MISENKQEFLEKRKRGERICGHIDCIYIQSIEHRKKYARAGPWAMIKTPEGWELEHYCRVVLKISNDLKASLTGLGGWREVYSMNRMCMLMECKERVEYRGGEIRIYM